MRNRSKTHFRSRSVTLAGGILCIAAAWLASIAAAENPQLALSTPAETADLLSPLDVHPRISLTIVEQLRHNHYLEKQLDDQQSSHIFENYLNMLDGAKVLVGQPCQQISTDLIFFETGLFKMVDGLFKFLLRDFCIHLLPMIKFNRFQTKPHC